MHLSNIKRSTFCKLLFIWLISILLGYSSTIFSQISEGGIPPSFDYSPTLRSDLSLINAPVDFYIEDLRETDYWRAREGAPMPVAKLISVDYSMDNSGYHSILPDGENIWRLQLKAKDAVAIMLYYSDFYIPEGGRLFIYNIDKTQVLGAFTHRTHPSGGRFATGFIGGDELILEYAASETSDENPRISICDIGYGYNTAALREFCNITTYATTAGSCEVNINCEEGSAWQNEKKGVCHTVQKIGSKAYICSGSLLNNTAEDFKPLILTALHCAYDETEIASEGDMEQWLFYFHKERNSCSNTSLGKISRSMTGCKLLASTGMEGGSDGLLLLLNDTIPDEYDVFYNGWDCTGDAAVSGVSIHHPQGDYKKISTYSETLLTYTFMATEFTGESNAHWNAIFVSTPNGHGVTEGGSSGSPLFNENKLIVGTLSGGGSSCSNRRGVNLYGKFSFHWNRYKTNSKTRMDVWLDPLNKGTKTLQGRFRKVLKSPPENFEAVYLGQSVSLSWSEPLSSEKPKHYNLYRNNTKIVETASLSFIDNDILFGTIIYSVTAVYEGNEESSFASKSLLLIKYKAPSELTASRLSSEDNQIELSWKAPLYEQTVYWGTKNPTYMIGFDEKFPFYFGQKWSADEINPLHLKTITAIQFFPISENSYEIFITQGAHSYRQPIEDEMLRPFALNTINLSVPFVIDGSNSLIISILVSNPVTDYPAVCDDGPAVNGKGNLCAVYTSTDEIEWELLNDNEEPGEYDYNFIVAAIISSEIGELPSRTKSLAVSKHDTVLTAVDHAALRKSTMHITDNEVTLRNSVPAAFPEISKYVIYKNSSYYKNIIAPETTFIDKVSTDASNIYYQVSAFYDQIETEKTDKTYVSVLSIDGFPKSAVQIFPTIFKDYVFLQGSEFISRIEIIAITGQISLVVTQPDHQIDTSSLMPGIYFFRILDSRNNQHVIKAVKTR